MSQLSSAFLRFLRRDRPLCLWGSPPPEARISKKEDNPRIRIRELLLLLLLLKSSCNHPQIILQSSYTDQDGSEEEDSALSGGLCQREADKACARWLVTERVCCTSSSSGQLASQPAS